MMQAKVLKLSTKRRAAQFELYFSSGLVSNKQRDVYHEEQFGPVVPILTFNDIQEPLNDMAEFTVSRLVYLGKILKHWHH
jgi:acyl-CoA reductase-like NAD-dependent aldehyde dehydrogenase